MHMCAGITIVMGMGMGMVIGIVTGSCAKREQVGICRHQRLMVQTKTVWFVLT